MNSPTSNFARLLGVSFEDQVDRPETVILSYLSAGTRNISKTIKSGWSSFMVPSLATYFGQTSSTKSLNYHYKRNILATNVFFGLIFACLVIHLNVGSAESSYLKRNRLLCCHQYGGHLSNASLSPSSKPCKE